MYAMQPVQIATKFQNRYYRKNVNYIDATSGAVQTYNDRFLFRTPGITPDADQYYTAKQNGTWPRGILTGQEISGLISRLVPLLFHGNNHLLAKQNPAWQRLYHYAVRQFSEMDNAGNIVNVNLGSYPCHYCGLILPEAAIQVDHRQPKAGGEGIMVVKMLHSISFGPVIGLARGAATGAKGLQATAIATGPANALHPIAVKGWARANAWTRHPHSPAKERRYTLDIFGETFLSITEVLFGANDIVASAKNCLLNLAPSCAQCNRAKKNIVFARK